MFRYIAIAWDTANPTASALAAHLDPMRLRPGDWELALRRPGLRVLCAGARPGVNEANPLQSGTAVILGKLFRRRPTCGASAMQATSTTAESSARQISLTPQEDAAISRRLGEPLVSQFWGRYVAFFQTGDGATRVLRDPSGTLPCYRIRIDGVSVVFSWLEDALDLLGSLHRWRVNWGAFRAHLLGGSLGGPQTALDGVMQVLPGESWDLMRGRSTMLWNAVDFARTPQIQSDEEATEWLRQGVRSCAEAWASCYDCVMLRLSGGVDSSILASCLAPGRTPAMVVGLNYHSPGSDSDERGYARLIAERARRELLEQERDREYRVAGIHTMARTCEPVRYLGWMNSASDARLAAARAAPAMFTGAGGDSLFYEFASWWPAADYLSVRGFDSGFPNAAMDAARLGRVSVWRAVARSLKGQLRPHDIEREVMGSAPLLSPELRASMDERRRFDHPALQQAGDIPVGKRVQTIGLMQPLMYYDPFSREAAPEFVSPLLSQPLVELCLRMPTYQLTRGGYGRAMARRAFAGDLPPQIAHRRSKGGLEEHVKAVLKSNLDHIRPLLLEGQLAQRGLLNASEVAQVLSDRPTGLEAHAGHIHGLVAAEAWLGQWTR